MTSSPSAAAEPGSRRRFAVLVAAALCLHLSLVVWAGPGFNCRDDIVYASCAWDVTQGAFEFAPEHRVNRVGLIHPTALVYLAFGVTRWTTIFVPLVASLGSIVASAVIARRMAGPDAGVLAAFLMAPSAWLVNDSAYLMPDVVLGLVMLCAALLLRARLTAGRPSLLGAASALCVVAGVLVKLTVLWIAPVFIWYFVSDLRQKRHARFWGTFAAVGIAGAIVFFAGYHLTTGDALYRVHAVSSRHNETHWAMPDASWTELVARATYEPFLAVADRLPGFMLLVAAALPAFTAWRSQSARTRFWLAYTAVFVATFWFGSTSFTAYSPIPLIMRMLSPTHPVLASLAAAVLVRAVARRTDVVLTGLWLAGAVAVVVVAGRPLAGLAYAAGAGALVLAYRSAGLPRPLALSALPLVTLATCAYGIVRGGVGETRPASAERALVRALAEHAGDAPVLTDRASLRAMSFHHGFSLPEGLRVVDFRETPEPPPTPYLLYLHAKRLAWREGRRKPPEWVDAVVEGGETLERAPGARLVRVGAP